MNEVIISEDVKDNESMYGFNMSTKTLEKQILIDLNEEIYNQGIITYDLFVKAKAHLEKL